MENIEQVVRNKINKIQIDHANSKGLTQEEAEIAVKLGLIDEEQIWFWLEDWQKDERKSNVELERILNRIR